MILAEEESLKCAPRHGPRQSLRSFVVYPNIMNIGTCTTVATIQNMPILGTNFGGRVQ